MTDIFISYSRRDIHIVEKLRADLGASGFEVWQDKERIHGGHRWKIQIEEGIENTGVFLLVASQNSFLTENVGDELEAALHDNKPLILLNIGQAIPPNGLKWLNKYHAIFHQRNGSHIGEIAEALEKFGIAPRKVAPAVDEETVEVEAEEEIDAGLSEEEAFVQHANGRLQADHPELAAIEAERQALELEKERLQKEADTERRNLDSAHEVIERERKLLETQRQQLLQFDEQRKQESEAQQKSLDAERSRLEQEDAELGRKKNELESLVNQTEVLREDQSARLRQLESEIAKTETDLETGEERLAFQEHRNEVALREGSERYQAILNATKEQEAELAGQLSQLDSKIAELKRTQKRPLMLITVGIFVVSIVAAIAVYIVKPQFLSDFWDQTATEELVWDELAGQRESLANGGDWGALLSNAVVTHDRFLDERHFADDEEKKRKFQDHYELNRSSIHDRVNEAIDGLLKEIEVGGQLPESAEPEVVLKSLEVISSWDVAPKAGLLRAKIRMPASTAQGDFAAALREFHDAIKLDPESAKALQSELEATTAAMVRSFSAEWRLDRQIEILESIQQLPAGMVFNSDADPRLLRQCVLAEELRNQGQPLEALVAVLSLTDSPSQWFPTVEQQSIRYIADVAKLDFEQREKALGLISGKSTSNSGQSDFFRDAVEPIVASIAAGPMKDAGNALELFRETAREAEGWDVILKPRVSEILAKLKPAAAEDLDGVASELVETAEFWKLGAAYVILATHEGDTNTGFNYWLKAEEFGDIDSKAAVGRMLVRFGQSDADLKAGLLKVQEAAEADNRNGLFELGCFYRDGTGVAIDLPKSIELLTRADTAGHPDAKFQLGLAEALQGMETNSKEAFESAVANFNAIAAAKPHAYYWLYVCYITPELNDLDKAREALEEGANQADPKSLHALGLALLSGSAPFKENVSVGREHMLKAGLAGVVDAGKWCIKEEERINRDGTEDERAWVVRNKEAIAKFRD